MADGAISLDFLLNDQASGAFNHAVDSMVQGTHELEAKLKSNNQDISSSNKETADKFVRDNKEANDKVIQDAGKTRQEIKSKFSNDIKVKLVSQAETAGIKNFDAILKRLPKKQRTELLAKAEKGEAIDFEALLKKVPTRVATKLELNDQATPAMKDVQREAQETSSRMSRLKEITLGALGGNIIYGAIGKISGAFMSLNQDLAESSASWQTFEGNMHQFGKSDAEIARVRKELQVFAQQSIYSSSEMATTYAQLAAVGTKNTTELVKGFGGLAAAAENPKQAMTTLSQQATQMAAKPKVAWEDFKLMLDQTPAGMAAVAQSMGMSTGELIKKVQSGTLSTQEFLDAIAKVGTSDNFAKMATQYKTTGQAMDGLRETLVNKVQKAYDSTSQHGIKMISSLTDSIDKVNFDNLLKGPMNFIGYMTSHTKELAGIGRSVKDIAGAFVGGAWNAAKDTISFIGKSMGVIGENTKKSEDPLHTTERILSEISKHKKGIEILGATLAGVWAVSKVTNYARAVNGLFGILGDKKLTGFMASSGKAVGKKLVYKTVIDSEGSKQELTALGRLFAGQKAKFNKMLSWTAHIAVGSAKKAFSVLAGGISLVGKSFLALGKLMLTNPIGLAITIFVALGVAVYEVYKHNKKFKESVDNIGKAIGKFVSGSVEFFKKNWKDIGLLLINPFVGFFNLLYKHNDGFKKFFDGLMKSFKKGWNEFLKFGKALFKGLGMALIIAIALPVGILMKIFGPLVKALSKVIGSMSKEFNKWAKSISKELTKWGKSLSKTWHSIWDPIAEFFSDLWDGFTKKISKFTKDVIKTLTKWNKEIGKTWKKIWDPIADFFSDTWDDIKKTGIKAWDWLLDKVHDFGKAFSKAWHKLWDPISDFFSDIWNGIKRTAKRAWNWMSDKLSDFGKSVSHTWHNTWNGIKDFFGDIWNDIKGKAKRGINDVIDIINTGIGGINGVIHTFGGKKNTITKIPKFAKGTGNAPAGLAMVNDGAGEEAIIDNSGEMHVLEGRNRLVQFSGGETVVPHEATKSMFGGNIPHFKSGTSSWWEGLSDWAKDKWDSLKNFIKHPMRAVGGLMDKAVNSMLGGKPELVTKLAPPMGHGFVSGIIDPITKLFKDLNHKHQEDVESKDIGAGGNWRSAIEEVAKEMHVHVSDSDMSALMARINKESGGRQNIKQGIVDINSLAGHPAQGLFQFIPSTFASYAVPGHTNILNGKDQIRAVLNDSNWRSDIRMPGGWGPTGHRVFGDGGRATQPSIFGEVPGEPEWAINPRRASADSLIQGAINERAEVAPNSSTAKAARLIDMAKSGIASARNTFSTASSQSANGFVAGSTGVDLSGDTTIVLSLDSGEVAKATFPKIKLLQDQDIQITAQANGLGGAVFG